MSGSRAIERYEKFQAGKTFEEIAREDGVEVETVRCAIREERTRRSIELRECVQQRNHRLRDRIQRELNDDFILALKKLLAGKKEIAFCMGNQILTVTVDDNRGLMEGIRQFRGSVCLEEKPTPAPATIVNVQQNNRVSGLDFEERMRLIRKKQQESIEAQNRQRKVVDLAEEEEGSEKEAEWAFSEPGNPLEGPESHGLIYKPYLKSADFKKIF